MDADTSIDFSALTATTRTVVKPGIDLPYRHETKDWTTGVKEILSEGIVFVDREDIEALTEQGRWDSQSGNVLTLGYHEGAALEAIGVAVRETRGGYHGNEATKVLLSALWPEEYGPYEPKMEG